MSQDETDSFWRRRWPVLAAAAAAVLLIGAVAAHQWLLPWLIRHSVQRPLPTNSNSEARLSVSQVELRGLTGVSMYDVRLQLDDGRLPNGALPVLEIPHLQVSVRLLDALTGSPTLADLRVNSGTLQLHRFADGHTSLSPFLPDTESDGTTAGDEPASTPSPYRDRIESAAASALRRFGGQFPAVDAQLSVEFSHASGAAGWGLRRVEMTDIRIVPYQDTAELEVNADFYPVEDAETATPTRRIEWPESISMSGTLRRPIWQSTGRLTFSPTFEFSGVGPAERLNCSIDALFVEDGPTFGLEGLDAQYRTARDLIPLVTVGSVSAEWPDLSQSGRLPEVHKVTVDGASIHLRYRGVGRSAWHDLIALRRQTAARHVAGKAAQIASNVASNREEQRPLDTRTGERAGSGLVDTLGFRQWRSVAPEIVELRGIEVDLQDGRQLPVEPFSPHLSLQNGRLSAGLHPDKGAVSLKLTFDALDLAADQNHRNRDSDDRPNVDAATRKRGSVRLTASARHWGDEISIDTRIRALSIPWVSQMLGRRAARTLRTGKLSANISSSSDADSSRHSFQGSVSATNLTAYHPRLAKEPVESIAGRYRFEGYWDPDEIPGRPKLLPKRADAFREANGDGTNTPVATNRRARSPGPAETPSNSTEESADDVGVGGTADAAASDIDVEDGVLHFSRGDLTFQGLKASFRPRLTGISAERRPSRLDLFFELPETRLQTMIEALPEALLGPLQGTQLRGRFGWKFYTEIPLFEAGEMEWNSRPKTRGIQLVHLPREVDVRDLTDGFHHTIHNPDKTYERSVRIPEMKPVPAPWLLANAEMTLTEIDTRRRERNWPPVPGRADLPAVLPTYEPPASLRRRRPHVVAEQRVADKRRRWQKIGDITRRPEVWLTKVATQRAASPPWESGEPIWFLPDERISRYEEDRLNDLIDTFQSRSRTVGADVSFSHPSPKMRMERLGAQDQAGWEALQRFLGKSTGDATGRGGNSPSNAAQQVTKGWFKTESLPTALAPSAIGRFGKPRRRHLRLNPYGPYRFVPLHHISKWMTRAIMTFEDNSFFEHNGFNWHAIQESVEDNLEAGGFVRGASTVSMQLVKNLYLSFDKVLARKLREVFLVWLMENVVDVPKARILEVYFNIIEFGPGVFGIHDAALHYFGKRPDELTLMEVVWLVSIIPNPPKHHRQWEYGQITRGWAENLRAYVDIMYDRDRVSKETKNAATSSIPEFFKPKLRGVPLRIHPPN